MRRFFSAIFFYQIGHIGGKGPLGGKNDYSLCFRVKWQRKSDMCRVTMDMVPHGITFVLHLFALGLHGNFLFSLLKDFGEKRQYIFGMIVDTSMIKYRSGFVKHSKSMFRILCKQSKIY
jgi:hypothetical protein